VLAYGTDIGVFDGVMAHSNRVKPLL